MPGVEEDLSAIAVDAQHSCYLSILFEVEGVITVELDWVGGGGCARDIRIEIFLGVFDCLLGRDSHGCRGINGNCAIPTAHHYTIATHHSAIAAHTCTCARC